MVGRRSLLVRVAVVAACCAVMWAADRLRTTDDSHLGVGRGPVSVAVDPGGTSVYVALFDTREIWQLDAASGAVRARLPIPDLEPKFGLVPIALDWSASLGAPVFACHRWGSVFLTDFGATPPRVSYFEPAIDAAPADPASGKFDGPSLVGYADGLDDSFVMALGQVRTTIESVELVRVRHDPTGWTVEAASEAIALEHGYQRGAWPLVTSVARRTFYLAEPGTGRLFEIGEDLVRRREIRVGRYPFAFALDDASGRLYIADKKLGALTSIDLERFTIERQVPVCAGATSLALDAGDAALWVACQHDAAIVRLDVPALTEARRVTDVAEPAALALAPDHRRLWVAELGRGALAAIDTRDPSKPTQRWLLDAGAP